MPQRMDGVIHLCPHEVHAFIYAWPWLRLVLGIVRIGLAKFASKKEKQHV